MPDAAEKAARPLDDVMIAMDVVDTLRHDKRVVDRELNEASRRAELIEELRKIYKGQGIEVPDHILEEGVKALEEKRFVYTPPANSWQVRLARLYVTRDHWGRTAAGTALAATLVGGGWYMGFERPRAVEQAALERELTRGIPARVDKLVDEIAKASTKPEIAAEAKRIGDAARAAAASGDRKAARAGVKRLEETIAELGRTFEIRIINRKGEITGLWRVPKVNPLSRNYYLVVEAVDPKGNVLPRSILNEETGKRETVTRWAVRVPKSVFDEIQADKLDDGIIQKAVIATKPAGDVEPRWRLAVSGGALTRW